MKTLKDIVSEASLKNFDPTARSQRNMTKGKKIVHEISMNNEHHPFYSEYVEGNFITGSITKMKKAIDALKKNVPGGTWTVTVDGRTIKIHLIKLDEV